MAVFSSLEINFKINLWIFKSRKTKKSFDLSLILNLHSTPCIYSKLEITIHFLKQLFSWQESKHVLWGGPWTPGYHVQI